MHVYQAGLRSELEIATDEMEKAQQRLAALEREKAVLQGTSSPQVASTTAPNKVVEDSLRNELQNQVAPHLLSHETSTRPFTRSIICLTFVPRQVLLVHIYLQAVTSLILQGPHISHMFAGICCECCLWHALNVVLRRMLRHGVI